MPEVASTTPSTGPVQPDFSTATYSGPAVPPPRASQPAPPQPAPPQPAPPQPAAASPAAAPDHAAPAAAPPARPAAAAPPPKWQELVRKAELEAALAAAPDDTSLRAAYFALLAGLSLSNTGLIWAHLPEVGAPLALRAGTPDIGMLAHVFRDRALDIEMAATPLQILLIGAHVGYAAVALALRYPRATILAAEPLRDNFRLLTLNTGAWRRIRAAQAAVWHSSTRLAPRGRFQGDWAVRLSDEGMDAERVLPAVSVRELLGRAGWDHADLIVCDASGAEREIFADRLQPWLAGCDALLVRLYEATGPGGGAAVQACFPADTFEHRRVNEMDLFTRRIPRTAQPDLPAELLLIRPEPGLKPFRLSEVPQAAFGFFAYDGVNCQLHPNATPGRPSRALFGVDGPGHTRFVSGITHAGISGAHAIVFTVMVLHANGVVAARADERLEAGASGRLTLRLPEMDGPFHIVLQTEMAPGSTHNQMAWARFLEPKLV